MSWLPVACVAVLMLSGCAAATETDDAGLGGASVEGSGGVVEGLVLSEEFLPIAGAQVRLENDAGTNVTDASGAFRFEGLSPGSILLEVVAPGYLPSVQRVDVLADAAATVRILLVASPIPVPHVETLIFNGYIRLGNAFVDASFLSLGQSGGCEKCVSQVDAKSDLMTYQLEMLFKTGIAKPTGPLQIGWQLWNRTKAQFATDLSGVYGGGYLSSGGKAVIHQDTKDTWSRWTLGGEGLTLIHYCDATWVCVEQRFQSFSSLAYLERIAPDYTALPDT